MRVRHKFLTPPISMSDQWRVWCGFHGTPSTAKVTLFNQYSPLFCFLSSKLLKGIGKILPIQGEMGFWFNGFHAHSSTMHHPHGSSSLTEPVHRFWCYLWIFTYRVSLSNNITIFYTPFFTIFCTTPCKERTFKSTHYPYGEIARRKL